VVARVIAEVERVIPQAMMVAEEASWAALTLEVY